MKVFSTPTMQLVVFFGKAIHGNNETSIAGHTRCSAEIQKPKDKYFTLQLGVRSICCTNIVGLYSSEALSRDVPLQEREREREGEREREREREGRERERERKIGR